ncbi:hypothetical protein [Alteromonas sp. ASW11-130]|uniref:hypothetical protein n=1 Tax=Alteromonas sp. ASW11-130 TaxID=3015775 RepID=UPI002242AC81|nr:hypothetical protein [Alteromonas sp. ASW11-130]MCW8092266.1 hypothetical protein [Alteromonas sp. ASW11-130]
MAKIQLGFFCLILLFTSSALEANQDEVQPQRGVSIESREVCNAGATKCQLVGSAGPWLLSIFETSVEACEGAGNTSDTVHKWLESNLWLIDEVKKMTPEYSQLIKIQKNFWNVPRAYLDNQCFRVSKAVEEASPLNHGMR